MKPIAATCGALALVLGLPPGRGLAEPIEICGTLEELPGCVVLVQLGPGEIQDTYRVDPAPDPLPDYPVILRGEVESCGSECMWVSRCIRPTEIVPCAPFDLGCGNNYSVQCNDWPHSVWESPVHGLWGTVNAPQSARLVKVHLWGWLDASVGSICLIGEQGVAVVDSFVVCPDSLSAIAPVSWGRLKSRYRD